MNHVRLYCTGIIIKVSKSLQNSVYVGALTIFWDNCSTEHSCMYNGIRVRPNITASGYILYLIIALTVLLEFRQFYVTIFISFDF